MNNQIGFEFEKEQETEKKAEKKTEVKTDDIFSVPKAKQGRPKNRTDTKARKNATVTLERFKNAIPEEDENGNLVITGDKVMRDKRANFPTIVDYDPADVSQALKIVNYWRVRGLNNRIMTNRELVDRIEEYLYWCQENGVKPVLECCSLATGYTRVTFTNWRDGIGCDSERQRIIEAFFETMASFDALMAVNGKLNPVLYFFRSKNLYGMRDQQDIVVTPNKNPLGDTIPVEEISKKYEYLPED